MKWKHKDITRFTQNEKNTPWLKTESKWWQCSAKRDESCLKSLSEGTKFMLIYSTHRVNVWKAVFPTSYTR